MPPPQPGRTSLPNNIRALINGVEGSAGSPQRKGPGYGSHGEWCSLVRRTLWKGNQIQIRHVRRRLLAGGSVLCYWR